MHTYEQLGEISKRLAAQGWERLNGNTWASPHGRYTLTTAYVWQEATLVFMRADTSAVQRPAYYRGPDPLTWAEQQKRPRLFTR